jgi:hypothetical protein
MRTPGAIARSGQHSLRPLYPEGNNSNTHRIGGWLILWSGLNVLKKSKIPCSYWDSNHVLSVHHPPCSLVTTQSTLITDE